MHSQLRVLAGAGVLVIALTGLAIAQDEIPDPVWEPTVSGMPEPMSLTVENVAQFDGSPVGIPFTIDQPATVYLAVYSVGANPDPVPRYMDHWQEGAMGSGGYYDGEKWIGTPNAIVRAADTHIDTLVWRTSEDGVEFVAGSHTITWPGTNKTGEQMPAGTYAYYLVAWGAGNPVTVGRSPNGSFMDFRIDWSADPPEVWAWFGRNNQSAVIIHCYIGTDWAASPDAYEMFDATPIIRAVHEAGGEPDARINQYGLEFDPQEEGVFYISQMEGPAAGVHKIRLTDGVFEPVTEWADNGHFWMPQRVYDVVEYDGYIWAANYNRVDILSQALKLDGATGELVGAVDFTEIYTTSWDGENFFAFGPQGMDVGEWGVVFVTPKGAPISLADLAGKILWVNDNGDGFGDAYSWDHDNNPETANVEVIRDWTGSVNFGPYGFMFPAGIDAVGGKRVGMILGPDGSGIGRVQIPQATGELNTGDLIYHEADGAYDGFYKSIGYEPISDAGQIEANGWEFEPEPGWLVYVPGRILMGYIGGTGVRQVEAGSTPESYALSQNLPNPFNPSTAIHFSLPEASRAVLSVHNLAGQQVVSLVDQELKAGSYSATWNGRDSNGRVVSSGVYVYTLRAGAFTDTKRMILMK